MKMNLPNKLTILRLCLVPVILIVGMIPMNFYLSCFICAVLFIVTSITDMLDGKIARKYNLITDFGKFLDPIADKFMVIGALFVVLYKFEELRTLMIFVILVIVFRELAVTSMRLVVSTGQNIVIAANYLGKLKTVSQIVFICTVFLEPVLQFVTLKIFNSFSDHALEYRAGGIVPLTYLTMAFTVVMTVWSGINYILGYWKYLDPEK
ncbi:MAG: CDP-diacylglycerol--glycerol-3-phosphate 3-phosphatidyltransferase [Clostridia bacterium]|nr:CDP-diacylglycerol--glycerol-3-phosphate 3-phosphatidyltransferase [Clostridia bacterium]